MSDAQVRKSPNAAVGKHCHLVKNSNNDNNNKKPLQSSMTVTSSAVDTVEKQLYGFHPLRSLRNIFFGYRNKPSPLSEVATSKAKSTENLSAISNVDFNVEGYSGGGKKMTPIASPEMGVKEKSPALSYDKQVYDKRRSVPYCSMLSISADDLLETTQYTCVSRDTVAQKRPSIQSTSTTSTTDNIKSDEERRRSTRLMSAGDNSNQKSEVQQQQQQQQQQQRPFVAVTTSDETEDFFEEKWSTQSTVEWKRSLSHDGITTASNELSAEDLDVVDSKYNLDVSVVKNKLAVKQKGKRATAVLQQKIDAARRDERRQSLSGAHACDIRPDDSIGADTSSVGHGALNGIESTAVGDVNETSDVLPVNSSQSKRDSVKKQEDSCSSTASNADVSISGHRKDYHVPNVFGPKIPISSEQLVDALRRKAASRENQRESFVGKSGAAPSTAAKPSAAPAVRSKMEQAISTAVTPTIAIDDVAEAGQDTVRVSRSVSDKCESARTDGAPQRTLSDAANKVESAEYIAEHKAVRQSTSAPGQSAEAAVVVTATVAEASAITDAARKLKTRPKTIAPVIEQTTTEPAWKAELAAKKKFREIGELTNM